MKPTRTATFNGRKYKIEEVERIDGVTDVPGEPDPYIMMILAGNDLKALHSSLHEGFEASGACDNCVHGYGEKAYPKTWDVARFLWRRGWRRNKGKE